MLQKFQALSPAPSTFYGNPASWAPYANAYGSQAQAQAAMHASQQQADASKAASAAQTNQTQLGVQGGILNTLYSQPGQFANAMAGAAGAQYGAMGQAAAAQGQVDAARYGAAGNAAAAAFQQPGQFAQQIGNIYGSQAQGLGLAANALAGLGQGYGAIAQAQSNEKSNLYGANAMAEAARQNALSNQGVAAMGAYGNASNNAMQSHALNTTGYMKALSDMMAANQGSQGLVGQTGVKSATLAGVIPGVMEGLGGGSFNATGTQGPIASGSYSSGAGQGGAAVDVDTMANTGQVLGGLNAQSDLYRQQLERGFMGQAGQSRAMLGDTLSGVSGLLAQGSAGNNQGMNQFYANQRANPTNYGQAYGGLNAAGSSINQIAGNMNTGASRGYQQVGNLWGQSMGNPAFIDRIKGVLGAGGSGSGGSALSTIANSRGGLDAISRLFSQSLGKTGAYGGQGPLASWLAPPKPVSGRMRIG